MSVLAIAFALAPLGRCSVDYHTNTVCGGGGTCTHPDGFGMHWLPTSTCECTTGHCYEVAKTVTTAGGQETVGTCRPCATVDMIYNTTTLAAAFPAWTSGVAPCSVIGAGVLSAPNAQTTSSSAPSTPFVVGPDTVVEVTFHGAGADGHGGAVPLHRSLAAAPSSRGYLGVALEADGHFVHFSEGGGYMSNLGAVRTITPQQMAAYRGKAVRVHLVSSYHNQADPFGFICVSHVAVRHALPVGGSP